MRDLNKVMLIGRLGRDPEMRYTADGTPFTTLTLATGRKIEVPFEQLIIFSTNLEPHQLADDAFLRRIPFKVEVADPSPQAPVVVRPTAILPETSAAFRSPETPFSTIDRECFATLLNEG